MHLGLGLFFYCMVLGFDLDLHEIDIFYVWLHVTNILILVSWIWTLIFGWHKIILFIYLFFYIVLFNNVSLVH